MLVILRLPGGVKVPPSQGIGDDVTHLIDYEIHLDKRRTRQPETVNT